MPPVRTSRPPSIERRGERVGVRARPAAGSRGTRPVAAILKQVAFAAIACIERAALHPGEDRAVERLRVLLAAEDEPGARAGERLVRRRGDEVAVRHRVRMQAGGDEPGEVRHVAEEQRADLVGDLAEAVRPRRCADRPSRRRRSASAGTPSRARSTSS